MKNFIRIIIIVLLIIGIIVVLKKYNNNSSKKENTTRNDNEIDYYIEDSDIEKSIFKKYYTEAQKTVSKMTIEEKVGQLFLVRYEKTLTESQKNNYPGGYILFAKDFENHTKESIKKELDYVKNINKYPLILGVDEEGGFVTRVSRFPAFRQEKFLSPRYYYETGGYQLLKETEAEKANLLKEIGLNLNLAPVADVSTNPSDFIYNRTFGRNANETKDIIQKMIEYANQNNINSCLKHFPGYGNNEDTHTGVVHDNRSYQEIKENDFLPFQAGINSKGPCVLVSHNVVESIDPTYPSSLSEKVIKELRDTLGFTGIIVTDDLAMDAVKEFVENNNAATLAINAGNDMIITSDFTNMYNEVLKSVKEKTIKEKTLNKAVLRIMAWKYQTIKEEK